ncbi:molybdenum cofactor biosynthesis protein MoaE [Brachybacterium sp. GCM10030267]|uniref:molybdenum cofactor biosynthesis protein MoaE n=1 Tax=unclassified Brachybacterium TaxID=2623841 RepID=UPI003614C27E
MSGGDRLSATGNQVPDPTRGAAPFAGEPAADPHRLRVPGGPPMGEPGQRVRLAEIRESAISVAQMADAVSDPRCGAVVTFDGVVRDHDGGRGVQRLEYTAHPSAGEVIAEVAREIAERYPDAMIAVAHRHGPLGIGDSALTCAVSAPHRKQAFVACDDLVDTVKQRVPIWKHQIFEDGGTEWVGALG